MSKLEKFIGWNYREYSNVAVIIFILYEAAIHIKAAFLWIMPIVVVLAWGALACVAYAAWHDREITKTRMYMRISYALVFPVLLTISWIFPYFPE